MGRAAVKWTKQLLHIYCIFITLKYKFCIEANVLKKSSNNKLKRNLVKNVRGFFMEYSNIFEPI